MKKAAFGEAERRFASPPGVVGNNHGNASARYPQSGSNSNRHQGHQAPSSSHAPSSSTHEKKTFSSNDRSGRPSSGGSRPSGSRPVGSKSQAPKHAARTTSDRNTGSMSIAPKINNGFSRNSGNVSPRVPMGKSEKGSDFKPGGNVRNVILSREGGLKGRGGANNPSTTKPLWPASGPPNSVVAAGFVRGSAGRGGRDKFSRGGRGGRGGFNRR